MMWRAPAAPRKARRGPPVFAEKRDEWTGTVGPPVRSQQQPPRSHPRRLCDPHGARKIIIVERHIGRSLERNAHRCSDLPTGGEQTVSTNRTGLRCSGPGSDDVVKTTDNAGPPQPVETRAQAQAVGLREGFLVDLATQAFHDTCMESIKRGPYLGKRECRALPNHQRRLLAGDDPCPRRPR